MTDARKKIVECGFRLFLDKGYDGASMNDLVRITGLSKGAIYHHFADKAALHAATVEHFFTRFFPAQEPRTEEDTVEGILSELAEGMLALFAEIAAVVADRTAYYRFILSIAPKIRGFINQHLENAQARLAAAIRKGQANGDVTGAIPAEALAFHCLASLEGAALLSIVSSGEDLAERIKRTVGDLSLLLAHRHSGPAAN